MKRRLGLLVVVLLVVAALALPLTASAQNFICGSLSASDCTLIQTALTNLASARSLEFSGSVTQTSGMGSVVALDIQAEFTGFVQFGAGGEVTALDVVIDPASVTMGGIFSLPPSVGAAGVRLVDNVMYIGAGPSVDALVWTSLDLNTTPISRSFANSSPIALLGSNQNWQRVQDVEVIPGITTTFFESVSAVDPSAQLGDLGALMGSTTLGDLGALLGDSTLGGTDMSGLLGSMLGGMVSGVQVTQIGRLLIEPGTQLVRGIAMTDEVNLGDAAAGTGLDTLGQGGPVSGSSTSTEVLFLNYNVAHAFAAPPNATPMTPDQVNEVVSASGDSLGALITQYFINTGSTAVTDSLSGMDSNALLGSMLGGMLGGMDSNALGGMDSNMLGGLLGGMDSNALGGMDSTLGNILGGLLGGTGDFSGTFGSTVNNPVTVRGAVEIGQTVNGNLTSGQSDGYTITGTAGNAVQIALNAQFDTYLELRDVAGQVIASNDDFDGLNSQITFTYPVNGQFTIVARGFSSTASGPYTLTIAAAQAGPSGTTSSGGGTIAIGQTITPNLTSGLRDTWTFSANGGEVIRINMDAEFDTYLELYGPTGQEVARNDDANGLNSQIDVTLPTAGTYTIIARSFGDFGSGPYTLSLQLAQGGSASSGGTTGGSLTGGSLTGASTTTGSLTGGSTTAARVLVVGQPVTGNLVQGTPDQWTLALTAGQNIQINMDAEFDTVLELNGPDGTQVAFNDDFNGLDSQITYQAAVAGNYTLIARSFANAGSGPYTLVVAPAGTASGTTGGSLTGASTTTGGSLTGASTTTGGSLTGGTSAATALTCFDNAQIAALSSLAIGQTVTVSCPASCGSSPGVVWGSRFYTDDSSICGAAIHAGVISNQGGPLLLTIAPGQQSYTGSTQNGVTTSNWGSWSRSFTVAAPGR